MKILMIIILGLYSKIILPNCSMNHSEFLKEYQKLDQEAKIVYKKFKNTPISHNNNNKIAYSISYSILENDPILIAKIDSYNKNYDCLYFNNQLNNIEKSESDMIHAIFNNKSLYLTTFCLKSESNIEEDKLILKPIELIENSCDNDIPSYNTKNSWNAKQKDILIEKMISKFSKINKIKLIMKEYNNITIKPNKNEQDILFINIVEFISQL